MYITLNLLGIHISRDHFSMHLYINGISTVKLVYITILYADNCYHLYSRQKGITLIILTSGNLISLSLKSEAFFFFLFKFTHNSDTKYNHSYRIKVVRHFIVI